MKRPAADPFAQIRKATDQHRAQHGCNACPYANGPLLSVLAAAVQARRILIWGRDSVIRRFRSRAVHGTRLSIP